MRFIAGMLVVSFVLTPVASAFAEESAASTEPSNASEPASPGSPEVPDPQATPSGEPDSPESANEPETSPIPEQEPEIEGIPVEDPEEEEAAAALSSVITPIRSLTEVSESTRLRLTPEVDESTGTLTYKYPIVVPPGRNGLQPDLALIYNSANAARDSVIGSGWSVNIPYIERINRTGSNNLFSSNYFYSSLDGELASTTLTNFGAKDESGSFLKYEFATSTNAWTMTDKKGTVYKFGHASSTRQDGPSSTAKVFRWMLEEVRDTNDNFMSYEYFKDAGQIYPSRIVYAGNGSTPGVLEVNFVRSARTGAPTLYTTGFGVKSNYRITEIRTEVNDVWARKYALAYTTGDNTAGSYLDTITESGQDDSSVTVALPSTNLSYTTAATDWTYSSSTSLALPFILSGADFGMRTADINGDGLVDILCHRDVTNGTCSKSNPEFYVNNGSGWTGASATWSFPTKVDDATKAESFLDTSNLDTGLRTVDVNGDLIVDLVRGIGTKKYVYIGNGTSTWTYDSNWSLPLPFLDSSGVDFGMRMGDINGDGLPDIICHSDKTNGTCSKSNPEIYLNTGSGWTNANSIWAFPYKVGSVTDRESFLNSSGQDTGLRLVDVNGDNLADLARGYDTTKYIYLNTGSGWVYDSSWVLSMPFINSASGDFGMRMGDINGDGLIDILCHNDKSSGSCSQANPEVRINTGTGWIDGASTWTFPAKAFNPSQKEVFLTSTLQDSGVRLLDINGDGLDEFVRGDSGSSKYVYLNNEEIHSNLLEEIDHPEGGTTTIGYKSSALFRDGSNNLLNPDVPIVSYLVASIASDSAFGATETHAYEYEGGQYYFGSYLDRKFAGFSRITKTDAVGNKTVTSYHQGNSTDSSNGEFADHISKAGKPYRVEIQNSSGDIYQKTVNKWDRYDLGSGRNFVKKVRMTEMAYDGDSDHKDKTEEYDYDDTYGNLTEKIEYGEVSASNDGSFTDTGTDKYVTTIAYAANATPYIVGLPSEEEVVDQGSGKVRENRFYYDGQALGSVTEGNLTKQEIWKTGSSYIDIERSYDGTYGLVTQEKDPRDKITIHSYDAYNLHIATSTNPLSHATSYLYDYSSGKVKQVVDPNGRVFQNIFDGLDRVKEERQPDIASPSSLVAKTTRAYTDTSGGVRVQTTDHLDASTSRITYTYYDGLGRPIQTRKEMEGSNSFAVADVIYNSRGKIGSESLPYSSSGSSRTTATTTTASLITYGYDPLLRTITVSNAVGTTTTAYDDWKTSVTDPKGKVKHFYNDAYDNLARVDETNAGSTYATVYEWDGNKKLVKITDALGNVRNFTYDGLGRRLTAEDLHASGDATYGVWTYVYDDSGNLTSVTDPKSQTINYAYDDVNRKLTEDFTGDVGTEVAYTYDFGTDGIGRLTSVSAPGATTTYVYNPLGLATQETRTIDSISYQTDYTHDRQGNVLEITNPDSSKVKYAYNAAGQLETIQRKESTDGAFVNVVTDLDYGPHEKITSQTFWNGVTTTNAYDASKMYRLANKLTTTQGGSKVQDLAYAYDANNNITQIVDASNTNSSKTVDYAYDDLNRLLAATSTNVAAGQSTYAHSYSYNAIGNILTKTDAAGTYSYAGDQGSSYANPHAVTSIGSNAYTYDNNGNLLTETGGLANTWDYNNRLVQAVRGGVTSTYAYDYKGQRVTLNNGTTTTVYPTKFYNIAGATSTKHIFAGDELVATIEGTGTGAVAYAIHADHLGSSNAVTNGSGTQEEVIDYFPYGSIRLDEQAGTLGESRKYIGQEYDSETELSYLNARYYDGGRGQFLSQDPVFLRVGIDSRTAQALQDPQSLNSYSYAKNNPIVYKDPNGEWIHIAAGALIGGGVGFVGQGIQDAVNGNLSGYQAYAGAVAGGATFGAVTAATGGLSLVGAGVVGVGSGVVQSGVEQGLNIASGNQEGFDVGAAGAQAVSNGVTSLVPGLKIAPIGAGRGSFEAIQKQIFTKLSNGTVSITGLQPSTVGKIVTAGFAQQLPGITIQSFFSSISRQIQQLRKQVEQLKQQISREDE